MKAHKLFKRAFMEIMVALFFIWVTINVDTDFIDAIKECFEQLLAGNTNFSYVKIIIRRYIMNHTKNEGRLIAVLFCKAVWLETSFYDDKIGYFSLFALLIIITVYFLYISIKENIGTIDDTIAFAQKNHIQIRVGKIKEKIFVLIIYLLDVRKLSGKVTDSEVRRRSYMYAFVPYYDDS